MFEQGADEEYEKRYSPERKEVVLRKLLPSYSLSVPVVAKEETISIGALYNWRNQAKFKGAAVRLGPKLTPILFIKFRASEYFFAMPLYDWVGTFMAVASSGAVTSNISRLVGYHGGRVVEFLCLEISAFGFAASGAGHVGAGVDGYCAN